MWAAEFIRGFLEENGFIIFAKLTFWSQLGQNIKKEIPGLHLPIFNKVDG